MYARCVSDLGHTPRLVTCDNWVAVNPLSAARETERWKESCTSRDTPRGLFFIRASPKLAEPGVDQDCHGRRNHSPRLDSPQVSRVHFGRCPRNEATLTP